MKNLKNSAYKNIFTVKRNELHFRLSQFFGWTNWFALKWNKVGGQCCF